MQVSSSQKGLPVMVNVRRYASPGIDGSTDVGVLSSGAGYPPDDLTGIQNAAPYDWISLNPNAGHDSGYLIGNVPATKAPTANQIRSRRRGVAIWGGYITGRTSPSMMNVGGSVDLNTGADKFIANGTGAAASMVRVNGRNPQNMRLPVVPMQTVRGGSTLLPSGGQSPGFGPAVPVIPKLPQFNSVIRVIQGRPPATIQR